MIKFKLTTDDGEIRLGFGITQENIRLLKQGKPIYVDLNEMGVAAKLMILYGETEAQIVKTLKPYIGKDTVVHETD